MKTKLFLSVLFSILFCEYLIGQPKPEITSTPDNNVFSFIDVQGPRFNFTDGFFLKDDDFDPVQVVVHGLPGDGIKPCESYLSWHFGSRINGRIVIPKKNKIDIFEVSDMLVSKYNGSVYCFIVGTYQFIGDRDESKRPVMLVAIWNPFNYSFSFVGEPTNITDINVYGWKPKIAQDYYGRLIVCWIEKNPDLPQNDGKLMAKKYSIVNNNAPFYIATSNSVNIHQYFQILDKFRFIEGFDVAFLSRDYKQEFAETPMVTFVSNFSTSYKTFIKTYQTPYDDLTSGIDETLQKVDRPFFELGEPKIAVAYNPTTNLDYAVTYKEYDKSSGDNNIILKYYFNKTLGTKILNKTFDENTCENKEPVIAGGYSGYIVTWNYRDCIDMVIDSAGNNVILAKYIYNDGTEHFGFPYYYVANSDLIFSRYTPAVNITPYNGRDDVYYSFLFNDYEDDYYGYKHILGYAYRSSDNIISSTNSFNTSKVSLATNPFIIYPNPSSSGKIYIQVPKSEKNDFISIVDVLGKTVYSNLNNDANTNIQCDLSFLPKGVYLATYSSNNKKYSQKIVIN